MLFDSCKQPSEKQGNIYMSVISIGNEEDECFGIRFGVTTEMARYDKANYAKTQINNFITRTINHYLDEKIGKLPEHPGWATETRKEREAYRLISDKRAEEYQEAKKEIRIVHPFLGIVGFTVPFSEPKTAYEGALIRCFFGDPSSSIEMGGIGSCRTATTKEPCFLIGERGMKSCYLHRKEEMNKWMSLRNIISIKSLIDYCLSHQNDWKTY